MKKGLLKLSSALCCMIAVMAVTVMRVMASSVDNAITGLKDGKDNGVFDGVTSVVQETGNSAIKLGVTLGIIAAVIGLLIVIITLFIFHDGGTQTNGKKQIILILGCILFLSGIIGIVSSVASIGQSVGDSLQTNGTDSTKSADQGRVDELMNGDFISNIECAYSISLTVGDELA